MRFLLLYKIDVTNRYPVTTAVCGACAIYALMLAGHAMGWL